MDLPTLAHQSSAQPSYLTESANSTSAASNLDLLVNKQYHSKASSMQPQRRVSKQARRAQISQEILSQAFNHANQFRLFYPLVALEEAGGVEDSSKLFEEKENGDKEFVAGNNFMQYQLLEVASEFTERLIAQNNLLKGLKSWFDSLSLEERVNFLTTTSPFHAEVLRNMSEFESRFNCVLEFGQNPSPSKSHALTDSSSLLQPYTQSYNQYFLGLNNLIKSSYTQPRDLLSPFHTDQNLDVESSKDQFDIFPAKFDQHFFFRKIGPCELRKFKDLYPLQLDAFQILKESLRLSDVFMYLDSISCAPELAANSDLLFASVYFASSMESFKEPCVFSHERTIHTVSQPDWFKPERVQQMGCWIAAVFEQNLWAHYIHHLQSVKSESVPSELAAQVKLSIGYLYDPNESQDIFKNQSTEVKLRALALSWLQTPSDQKSKVLDSLKKEFLEDPDQGVKQKQKNSLLKLKVSYSEEVRNPLFRNFKDFFLFSSLPLKQKELQISSLELSELSKESLKHQLTRQEKKLVRQGVVSEKSAQKIDGGIRFMTQLMHTSLEVAHTGKDILRRLLLQKIQEEQQNQVIQELLEAEGEEAEGEVAEGDKQAKSKKKKKRNNRKVPSSDKDPSSHSPQIPLTQEFSQDAQNPPPSRPVDADPRQDSSEKSQALPIGETVDAKEESTLQERIYSRDDHLKEHVLESKAQIGNMPSHLNNSLQKSMVEQHALISGIQDEAVSETKASDWATYQGKKRSKKHVKIKNKQSRADKVELSPQGQEQEMLDISDTYVTKIISKLKNELETSNETGPNLKGELVKRGGLEDNDSSRFTLGPTLGKSQEANSEEVQGGSDLSKTGLEKDLGVKETEVGVRSSEGATDAEADLTKMERNQNNNQLIDKPKTSSLTPATMKEPELVIKSSQSTTSPSKAQSLLTELQPQSPRRTQSRTTSPELLRQTSQQRSVEKATVKEKITPGKDSTQRRKKRKAKGHHDPTEAMNMFIQRQLLRAEPPTNLSAKSKQAKGAKSKQAPSLTAPNSNKGSRIMSRRTSPKQSNQASEKPGTLAHDFKPAEEDHNKIVFNEKIFSSGSKKHPVESADPKKFALGQAPQNLSSFEQTEPQQRGRKRKQNNNGQKQNQNVIFRKSSKDESDRNQNRVMDELRKMLNQHSEQASTEMDITSSKRSHPSPKKDDPKLEDTSKSSKLGSAQALPEDLSSRQKMLDRREIIQAFDMTLALDKGAQSFEDSQSNKFTSDFSEKHNASHKVCSITDELSKRCKKITIRNEDDALSQHKEDMSNQAILERTFKQKKKSVDLTGPNFGLVSPQPDYESQPDATVQELSGKKADGGHLKAFNSSSFSAKKHLVFKPAGFGKVSNLSEGQPDLALALDQQRSEVPTDFKKLSVQPSLKNSFSMNLKNSTWQVKQQSFKKLSDSKFELFVPKAQSQLAKGDSTHESDKQGTRSDHSKLKQGRFDKKSDFDSSYSHYPHKKQVFVPKYQAAEKKNSNQLEMQNQVSQIDLAPRVQQRDNQHRHHNFQGHGGSFNHQNYGAQNQNRRGDFHHSHRHYQDQGTPQPPAQVYYPQNPSAEPDLGLGQSFEGYNRQGQGQGVQRGQNQTSTQESFRQPHLQPMPQFQQGSMHPPYQPNSFNQPNSQGFMQGSTNYGGAALPTQIPASTPPGSSLGFNSGSNFVPMNAYQMNQLNLQYQQHYFDQCNPMFIETKFYERFDQNISQEVSQVQSDLDATSEDRKLLLAKLQKICEEVFPENCGFTTYNNQKLVPKLKQFGSMITGLALQTSDMDLAVTNLNLPDRERMVDALERLSQRLKEDKHVSKLHNITTASIPVIKASVDMKASREEHVAALRVAGKEVPESLLLPMGEALETLKIDITFDDNLESGSYEVDDYYQLVNGFTSPHVSLTQRQNSYQYVTSLGQKSHQGLASCKLIKHFVEHYKCLREVSIVLKIFLERMGLNKPYLGGLSSYSTVLLLVAYMNRWNLKMSENLTPARLLMGFLDYYSYYFQVTVNGIDVTNGGSFFEHQTTENNFVILDPINDQDNNTSKNSYMTHQILGSFRKAFNTLKNVLVNYQNLKNPMIVDNLLDILLEQNQSQEQSQLVDSFNRKNLAGSDDQDFFLPGKIFNSSPNSPEPKSKLASGHQGD